MADEVFVLEEWAVHENERDGGRFLSGILPARHMAGRIETDRIVSSTGREVTVLSGKVYFLGEVLPEYRAFCAEAGCPVDPEYPVKVDEPEEEPEEAS